MGIYTKIGIGVFGVAVAIFLVLTGMMIERVSNGKDSEQIVQPARR
jgi:hypothetical protein